MMGQDGAAAAAGTHNAFRNAAPKTSISRLVLPTLLGSRPFRLAPRGWAMSPLMPMSRASQQERTTSVKEMTIRHVPGQI